MKWGTWLLAMMQPLIAKVLVLLGFQVLTISGVTASIAAIKSLLIANMQSIPAAGLQLGLLAGIDTALGIILGAVTFRITLWQIQGSTKILGKST